MINFSKSNNNIQYNYNNYYNNTILVIPLIINNESTCIIHIIVYNKYINNIVHIINTNLALVGKFLAKNKIVQIIKIIHQILFSSGCKLIN